ncbi:MAG TPA: phosphoglycerate dehydrogenase [Deltaproteobacteria bacterium]|nr:phosphoglycerate dehydrogenase [Deltaproteobacteria bacterium]
MPKILVSDKLSEAGLKILRAAPGLEIDVKTELKAEELEKVIPEYDALIIRSGTKVTASLLEKAKRLKIVGRAGIGVDNVDCAAASKYGIIVENTPSGNATTTAEQAIAMMFAVSRMVPQATMSMKEGKWDKKSFQGRELTGKILGIVGVGNIGKIVADRALGLKMKVIGYDPFLTAEAAAQMGLELVELDELFRRSDYVTVHVPLTDKTKNLIDKTALSKMKPGVFIINCARGGIVSEADLLAALESGKVGGAALDVFEKEPPPPDYALVKHPKVICTPHLGASTDEAQLNVAIEVAEQIVNYFSTGEVKNAVNFPSISAELAKVLQPYLLLTEKLGLLQGQLAEGSLKQITIEYTGDITKYPLAPMTVCVLKGLLESSLENVNVNYVNSPVLAKERGIKVVEAKSEDAVDFANLISVILETSSGKRIVSGAIFGKKNPRIVRIDDFYLEAVPEGTILVVRNFDRPGVIGNIGTLLGKNKVNISRMQLGLTRESGEALALYNVDGHVETGVLNELKGLPNIISVKEVKL